MAKNSGSTRATNSKTAAASRTAKSIVGSNRKVQFTDENGSTVYWAKEEDIKELPKGWSLDPLAENTYKTTTEISDNARYALNEIYRDDDVSFGSWDKGSSIQCKNLALAKKIVKQGKELNALTKKYNSAKTKEAKKNYENQIYSYIDKAKANKTT